MIVGYKHLWCNDPFGSFAFWTGSLRLNWAHFTFSWETVRGLCGVCQALGWSFSQAMVLIEGHLREVTAWDQRLNPLLIEESWIFFFFFFFFFRRDLHFQWFIVCFCASTCAALAQLHNSADEKYLFHSKLCGWKDFSRHVS